MEPDLRLENGHKFRIRMLGTTCLRVEFCDGRVLGRTNVGDSGKFAALLTIIGSAFDTERWPYHNVFIDVMVKVTASSKSPAVGTRVQCLLKDVIDLRLNGWLCHRPKQFEAPRKLDGSWHAAVISQGRHREEYVRF